MKQTKKIVKKEKGKTKKKEKGEGEGRKVEKEEKERKRKKEKRKKEEGIIEFLEKLVPSAEEKIEEAKEKIEEGREKAGVKRKKEKRAEKKEKAKKEKKEEEIKVEGIEGEKEIEEKERKEEKKEEAEEIFPPLPVGPEVAKERVELKPIPRISSGVPGLDEMIDGGFEENSIVLVNGDPGSGKTILGLQFLYESLKRGEAALYISFGEPRELLYPRMLSFGMNFQEYEDKKLFFVIEYQPHEVAKLMSEEGGTIYDIVTSYKVKRIVIDPISPYLAQYQNLYDARLALVRLFNVIRKWGATTLLLNEWSPHAPPIPSSALAEFLADGVINLIHMRTADGIQIRGIEVWKLCGIDHTEVARPFSFTKNGIVVYPNERLFIEWEKK